MTTPSKPVTFAELKKQWREKHHRQGGDTDCNNCADGLESLEQRVRELQRYSVGSVGTFLSESGQWIKASDVTASDVTALLGDKP